jgi:hypothetical protein
MPKWSSSYSVLFLNSIVALLSASGCQGLAKNEWASGSTKISVNGLWPSRILFNSSIMFDILPANSGSLSTNGLLVPKCYAIFSSRPSTVVKTPPKVP